MGACKIDTMKDARNLHVKYALNDAAGVKALLRDRHRIANRRFSGDYSASDILIDLNSAISSAGLTERQTEAIALVYGKWELTQKEAAAVMKITQQAVGQALEAAATRIAAVYERWEYGTITVEHEEDGATDDVV